MQITIACSGGKITGKGHINRSRILYNFFKKQGISTNVFILKDKQLNKKYENSPPSSFFCNVFKRKNNIIFLDFSSISVINLYSNIKKTLNHFIKKSGSKCIVIDSIKDEKLYIKNKNSIRVVPFIIKNEKVLSGIDYAVIDPRIFLLKKNIINKKIKILLTFGGSDFKNFILIFKAFAKIKNYLKSNTIIRVIVGEFCSKKEYQYVKKYLGSLKMNNIEIKHGCKNNINNYKWSNVVITNDGITKYEVSAAGRLPVVLRNSPGPYTYGKYFKKLKFPYIIDYHAKNLPLKLSKIILKIIKNKNLILKRSQMAKKIFNKSKLSNYKKLIYNLSN